MSRNSIIELYESALTGADPAAATAEAVAALNIPRESSVLIFAAGKAAATMTEAAVGSLLRSLHRITGGVMVTADGDRSPYPTIVALKGDHPIAGDLSFAAAERIASAAKGRRSTDTVIVLVSGGASSLIGGPLAGQRPSDLIGLHETLLAAGLDIAAMNAIRKRFSRWGGGRLAVALAPAAVHCLAVSDVPGDEPGVIGSGPCSPDGNTASDVSDIIERSGLTKKLAAQHRDYLKSVMRGVASETPKRQHPAFAHVTAKVIVSNRTALDHAAAFAASAGMRVEIVEDLLQGSAAEAGEAIARRLLAASGTRNGAPKCIIWGGETTVATGNISAMGGGGRCQELALAAARFLSGNAGSAAGIRLLAAGTDGRDGMTEAAGAVVDAGTWAAIKQAGIDPESALARHESNRALAAADALVPRRRTGTNVMDVAIGIIE